MKQRVAGFARVVARFVCFDSIYGSIKDNKIVMAQRRRGTARQQRSEQHDNHREMDGTTHDERNLNLDETDHVEQQSRHIRGRIWNHELPTSADIDHANREPETYFHHSTAANVKAAHSAAEDDHMIEPLGIARSAAALQDQPADALDVFTFDDWSVHTTADGGADGGDKQDEDDDDDNGADSDDGSEGADEGDEEQQKDMFKDSLTPPRDDDDAGLEDEPQSPRVSLAWEEW